jgi:adenosylcobinamide amidohydrolase
LLLERSKKVFKLNDLEEAFEVQFEVPMSCLSWAILGGGQKDSQSIYWARVRPENLPQHICPRTYLKDRMNRAGLKDSIGLMTSACLKDVTFIEKKRGPLTVSSLATVGMGNALRAGDPGSHFLSVGTINIVCTVNHPLTFEAQMEAITLTSEAKAMATLESGVISKKSGKPATGTGTDCTVLASPSHLEEKSFGKNSMVYSGKHTLLGELIGSSVSESVALGIKRWKLRMSQRERQRNVL